MLLATTEAKFQKHFMSWLAGKPAGVLPLSRGGGGNGSGVSITNAFFLGNEGILAAALRLSGGKIHRLDLIPAQLADMRNSVNCVHACFCYQNLRL
jgi:hypothetical protein